RRSRRSIWSGRTRRSRLTTKGSIARAFSKGLGEALFHWVLPFPKSVPLPPFAELGLLGASRRMARLHEYQGKAVLSSHGLAVPRGRAAASPDEARAVAAELACPVVVKIQAFTTGRAAIGGIAFADSPVQAAEHAGRMLGMNIGQFPVSHVLVEER